MAKISFLKEGILSHNISTNDGQTIYPATTANAVYDTQDRTLKDIINGDYNPDNTNIKDNGIYSWLDNLTNRFEEYTKLEYFNSLNNKVIDIKSSLNSVENSVNVSRNLINSVSSNFSNQIVSLSKQIYNPRFDSVPTKGSTNLLSSGAMYSYLSKIISKNVLDIKVVDNLDEYKADNGDIVMYGGENTEAYKFGSLYLAKVEYVRNTESICHEKTKKTTWTFLGSMIGECQETDLSNYYTKEEVRNLIPSVKEYYAGDNIEIDENNLIHARIPNTDLSSYYNRSEVDGLLAKIKVSENRYTPGDNITIEDGRISAIIPDTDNFVTNEYLENELKKLKITRYTAGKGITINDGVISAYINADNFISADSNNAVSNKTVATALSKKLQSEDVARIAMTGKYSDLIDAPQPKTYSIVSGDNVNIESETVGDNTEFKISVEPQSQFIEDVKVNGSSVVADKIANIEIPSIDVYNKNAYLMFGEKTTIANINGTDISVLMPEEPETSVNNNNPTLEFGKQSTIGSINDTELSIVMPQKPKANVESKNATLSYGKESVIAKVDGVDIKVTMPTSTVVPGVDVVNNNANLEFGKTSTIGSVNGTDLTVVMPAKPDSEEVSVTSNNATLVYGETATLASINGTDINVTMPAKPEQTTVSVNNNNPTLNYGQTATLGSINGTDITLKMPDATENLLTDVKVNGNSVVENKVANINIDSVDVIDYETPATFGAKTTLAKVGDTDITITLPSAPSSGGSVTVDNKSATLEPGMTVTLAKVNGTDITAKMPSMSNYYTKAEVNAKVPSTTIAIGYNEYMTYHKYGNMCVVQFSGISSSMLNDMQVKEGYVPTSNAISKSVYSTCMSSLIAGQSIPITVSALYEQYLGKWIFHVSNNTTEVAVWGQLVYVCD